MHFLFSANYTAQSSYANQARLLIPRLQALGHQIDVLEVGGGGNTPKQVDGVRLLPPIGDPIGNDSVIAHAQRIGAQAVITFFDQFAARGETYGKLNWWAWTPVDHVPLPPITHHQIQHAKGVIAMSRFGETVLKAAGYTPHYAPCAYDPALWFPLPETQRAEIRRALRTELPGLREDTFVVAFVGVNDSLPSRKGIPELLAAWRMFHDQYPNSVLYMHTSRRGNLHQNERLGVDIPLIMETLRIPPASILMPDDYAYRTGIPQRKLWEIAQAADWFISPGRGEGFGLPSLEFQACGTPIIASNFAAQAELNFDGLPIEGEFEWSWQGASVQKPGIDSIIVRLEEAYYERGSERYAQRRANVARVAEAYAIDSVIELYWKPVLRAMGESYLASSYTMERA